MNKNLASLEHRFMAAMIDIIPVVALSWAVDKSALGRRHVWTLFLIGWLVLQVILLTRDGQTLGKKRSTRASLGWIPES